MDSVSKTFVFSLVPIALAYNMAHFLSLLLIRGQYPMLALRVFYAATGLWITAKPIVET